MSTLDKVEQMLKQGYTPESHTVRENLMTAFTFLEPVTKKPIEILITSQEERLNICGLLASYGYKKPLDSLYFSSPKDKE